MIPEFSALVQKLETERNDLSYKTPKEMPTRVIEVPIVKQVRVRSDNTAREQKFYHAGRFAAGATDRVAVAADAWLQKELAK